MRKLRFAHILPLAQLVLAATLLEWDRLAGAPLGLNSLYVCYGINAPAMLILWLARLLQVDYISVSWMPFWLGHLLFLGGVVVLWYLVGRALEQRRSRKPLDRGRAAAAVGIWRTFLVLLGILLMSVSVEMARNGVRNSGGPGDLVAPALFAVWSGILIILPGVQLVKSLLRRRAGPAHQPDS